MLRTQSHEAEGFKELRFEDEADEEQIWLHTPGSEEDAAESDPMNDPMVKDGNTPGW